MFAGATFEGRTTNPLDRANDTLGTEYGGKVALEAWSWVTPATWVSVEASYATLFDTFKVGAQAGTNVFAKLAVGLEGQIDANETYGAGRAGVFAKTEFGPATLRAAGGFSADADFGAKLYGSLNVFFRY